MTNPNLKDYNGIQLFPSDYQFLKELEGKYGKPLPPVQNVFYHATGFVESDNRVVKVSVWNVELGSIPESIRNVNELIHVQFDQCGLANLTPDLLSLEKIHTLFVQNNSIKALPDDIDKLQNLKSLSIAFNQIQEFPATFENLKNLEQLYAYDNKLLECPQLFNFPLKRLNLGKNSINYLPEEFGNLKKLEDVRLRWTNLSDLPASFSNLINLYSLNIANNNFKYLPDCVTHIGRIGRLERIELYFNPLEEFPEGLNKFPHLMELIIDKTQFSNFQSEFEALEKNGTHILKV